jgi:hypothetical protein
MDENRDLTDAEKVREGLAAIESEMRRMIAGAKPYECGWNIWGAALSHTKSPDVMHPLWLIWGALTDWYEMQPSESEQAERAMVRAASEWLALSLDNQEARDAYFQRWVYDEMGYERKE